MRNLWNVVRVCEHVGNRLLRVECHAGYTGAERPLRIWLDGQFAEVRVVEDRWYSPGATYFRVVTAIGERYVLRHEDAQDSWSLQAFRSARGCPTRIDTKIVRSV